MIVEGRADFSKIQQGSGVGEGGVNRFAQQPMGEGISISGEKYYTYLYNYIKHPKQCISDAVII